MGRRTLALGILFLQACSSDGGTGPTPSVADDAGPPTGPSDAAPPASDGGPSAPEPTCEGVKTQATWDYVDPTTLPDFNATGPADGPTAKGLAGVAYGNGRFVATGRVAQQNKLLWVTSEDGVTWTKHEQALEPGVNHGTLKAVRFLGNKFVFFGKDIGTGFRVYTSADGLTWTPNKIDDSGNVVEDFVFDGTTAVVVGPSNTFYKSTDLTHWTPIPPFTSGSFGFDSVAVGAGHFVTTINTSSSVFSSTDATTWTPQTNVANNLRVVFGRGMFLGNSGDGLFTSADGTNFTKRQTTGLANGGVPFFSGGRFLFLSQLLEPPYTDQKLDASTDGVTFTELGRIQGHPAPVVYDVAFGKCRYVMAGWSQTGDDYKPWIISMPAAPAP